jgi:hypothetical protein
MFHQETPTMSRHERVAHWASIALAALLAVGMQAGMGARGADDVELKQTIGTIKAVEPEAGRISVITGCGHALRVMVFQAAVGCRIEVEGVAAPLTTLKRGQIVAVRYRGETEVLVATSIATVAAADTTRAK